MGLAGESGCGKSTLGKSLIRLDGRMRYVGGSVRLDGASCRSGTRAKMNRFRFKEVSIVPQYAMSALNPTRKIGSIAKELLESRGVEFDRSSWSWSAGSSSSASTKACSTCTRSSCRAG